MFNIQKEFRNILNLAWPNFIRTKEGFIFIEYGNDIDGLRNIEPNKIKMDCTAIETFYNHVHLKDVFKKVKPQELFDFGTIIGEMWRTKIENEYPCIHFRIYLTLEDNDVILRFHQIYKNEPAWLSEDDWEKELKMGKIKIWQI